MLFDGDRLPLSQRGWISDTASGATVAADGTIDWYCPGRFDSPAAFFRLLDPAVGGGMRIGPAGMARTSKRAWPGRQRYEAGTNVLHTRLRGRESTIELTDFMPWPGGSDQPPGRIVRIVRALRGPAPVEIEVAPTWGWGGAGRVYSFSEGIAFDGMVIRTGFPLAPVAVDRDRAVWRGVTDLDSGQRLVVTIDDPRSERHRPLSIDDALRSVGDTAWAWQSWLAGLTYDGAYRVAVERAALAVKSLTWYRSGAPVAAGTTSLPRVVGGERNRDHRWAWWRDAATAAVVLRRAGLVEESEAAAAWLRTAIAGSDFPIRPVADAEGGPAQEEEELRLPGWRHSEPVRIGVGPSGRQLDVCGDVIAAVRPGGALTGDWPRLVALTDWIADNWTEPDAGAWELTDRPVHLVATVVQCWSALDRMARVARERHPLDLDAAEWQQTATRALRWLDREGVSSTGQGLHRDGSAADPADASLLRVAWRGPWPAEHPIVSQTVDRVLARLSEGGLVRRYPAELDDGMDGTDPPDLVASLWAVRALAEVGRWEEAHERMETVCSFGQPVGLLAEAADPVSGDLLGDLPCTATHLAVIEAALALQGGPT